MVNESLVFKSLRFYCICISIFTTEKNGTIGKLVWAWTEANWPFVGVKMGPISKLIWAWTEANWPFIGVKMGPIGKLVWAWTEANWPFIGVKMRPIGKLIEACTKTYWPFICVRQICKTTKLLLSWCTLLHLFSSDLACTNCDKLFWGKIRNNKITSTANECDIFYGWTEALLLFEGLDLL